MKKKDLKLWRSTKVQVLFISECCLIEFVIDWGQWQLELSRTLRDLKTSNFQGSPEASIYQESIY